MSSACWRSTAARSREREREFAYIKIELSILQCISMHSATALPFTQELCVLAVNGGALQLLAGRSNCMERLLMLDGAETSVAASDFAHPSSRRTQLGGAARAAHTVMVLTQVRVRPGKRERERGREGEREGGREGEKERGLTWG